MFRNSGNQQSSVQRSFLLGERSLRAYLAGGNVRFLKDAEANLSMVGPDAKQYRDARFYLGITKAQLRKADESIEILRKLQESISIERARGSEVDFTDRISLQLAYAHIKKYTDEEFDAAEKILETLVSSGSSKNSPDLLLQAKSLQAFMYSVMAGYSKRVEKKPEFVRKARNFGEEVLKDPRSSPAVRFEALNALGITWMRFAENSSERIANPEGVAGAGSQVASRTLTLKKGWEGIGETVDGWAKAEDYFDRALAIVPNSVRVLQNKATLRLLQLDQGVAKDPSLLLKEAKDFVQRSRKQSRS
jgi:tetratricopeptide (TPR) repeat protein